jgi:hypothetical protein
MHLDRGRIRSDLIEKQNTLCFDGNWGIFCLRPFYTWIERGSKREAASINSVR